MFPIISFSTVTDPWNVVWTTLCNAVVCASCTMYGPVVGLHNLEVNQYTSVQCTGLGAAVHCRSPCVLYSHAHVWFSVVQSTAWLHSLQVGMQLYNAHVWVLLYSLLDCDWLHSLQVSLRLYRAQSWVQFCSSTDYSHIVQTAPVLCFLMQCWVKLFDWWDLCSRGPLMYKLSQLIFLLFKHCCLNHINNAIIFAHSLKLTITSHIFNQPTVRALN